MKTYLSPLIMILNSLALDSRGFRKPESWIRFASISKLNCFYKFMLLDFCSIDHLMANGVLFLFIFRLLEYFPIFFFFVNELVTIGVLVQHSILICLIFPLLSAWNNKWNKKWANNIYILVYIYIRYISLVFVLMRSFLKKPPNHLGILQYHMPTTRIKFI